MKKSRYKEEHIAFALKQAETGMPVRDKFAYRDCETITQPPALFHVVPRGWAGPSFLATLLFEKYMRCVPFGRKASLFWGSDRGGQRAANRLTPVTT